MANLVFNYATMNAGKTSRLLDVAYSYTSTGNNVICFMPDLDTRFGEKKGVIKSRLGVETPATIIRKDSNILDMEENWSQYDVVLVDEAQFLSKEQIQQLSDIADIHNVDVLTYGLRTDFKGELFEGAKALFELANKFELIKGVCACSGCSKQSTHVLRIDPDGNVVRDGDQVVVGAEDSYRSVCRAHYKAGQYS